MFKSDKQKFAIYSGSMSAGLIALLFLLNVFDGLELKTLDIRFRMLSEPATASKDIVFAVIDDNSLHAYESHNMPWPWPRSVYGELVNYFQQHGAKAVVFDILFASKDIYSTYFGDEQNDQQFVASMSEAKNVLLAIQLKEETGKLNFPFTFPRKNELPLSIAPKQKYSSGIFPPSEYQNVAQSVGVVNFISDRDNICRRLPLLFNFNDERVIPQLGFATYLMTMQQGDAISKKGKQLMVGKNKIPLDKDGNFILWWYGNGGPNQCFQYYSVHTILQSSIFEKRGEPSLLPQNTFQGKYVIIGSNAPGLLDFRPTPFTKDEKYPGMEIYATMLSNLLQKDFLRKEFSWITILIIMLISYSASFTMFHQTRVYKSVLITVGLASVWIAISCYFFSTQKLWLDIVPPIFALATSFAISSSWSYSSEGKARRQLRKTFNRYLDATVVRQLESNPNEAGLGGKEMEATVYFSDIKNFTSTCEHLKPQEVVHHLNEYFSVCVTTLLKHRAFLDKYVGDAVMAMFGIPLQKEDDSLRACKAALEIQNAVQRKKNGVPILLFHQCRIGLHSGKMVVGNVGTRKRMEYTAIGDTVNVASRLEGINKVYGTSILLSEIVYNHVRDTMVCREIDIVTLKGKENATRLYELLGTKESVSPEALSLIEQFHHGLSLYRNKNFSAAATQFALLREKYPHDEPIRIYFERCQNFSLTPPPENWDGVYDFQTK